MPKRRRKAKANLRQRHLPMRSVSTIFPILSDNDVLLPCSVFDELIISSYGGYASVSDLDQVRYVVDLSSGVTVLSFEENDNSAFVFDGVKGFVFKRGDCNYTYFDLTTGTETDLGIREAHLFSNDNGEGYAIQTSESLMLFTGNGIVWSINYSEEGLSEFTSLDIEVDFVPGTNECWVFVTDFNSLMTNAITVDMESGSSSRMWLPNSAVCFDIVTDGQSIV